MFSAHPTWRGEVYSIQSSSGIILPPEVASAHKLHLARVRPYRIAHVNQQKLRPSRETNCYSLPTGTRYSQKPPLFHLQALSQAPHSCDLSQG